MTSFWALSSARAAVPSPRIVRRCSRIRSASEVLEAPDRGDNEREGVSPVPAGARPQADAPALPVSHDAVAVPFPLGTGRNLARQDRKARSRTLAAPVAGTDRTSLRHAEVSADEILRGRSYSWPHTC
jgi:hypothetical protein